MATIEPRTCIAYLEARLVAEPSGAVAAAGYLFHRELLPPGKTVAVVSGGNIDPAVLRALLDRGTAAPAWRPADG